MSTRFIGLAFVILATLAQPSLADIKTITSVIDLSNAEAATDEIMKLSSDLEDADRSLYLDLTIKPVVSGENYNFPIDRISSRNGTRKAVKCDNGSERFSTATHAFDFNFNGFYNHFLFSILNVGPLQAPFNTVACEYNSDSPGTGKFVVRGYFAKSSISVPTAIEIELRPITP